jgi:hypothetical protein
MSTAGAPDSLRVLVWRKLRALGALYLQQSVCLLPARPEVVREVARLADRVHHTGGHARVLQMSFADPAQEHAVIEEMNTARDAEYAEVLQRLPGLLGELADEASRGRFTYAEVEESEADLDRFRAWLGKIAARDYFDAPAGATARAGVDDAASELASFEQAALHADTTGRSPGAGRPEQRAVEEQ